MQRAVVDTKINDIPASMVIRILIKKDRPGTAYNY